MSNAVIRAALSEFYRTDLPDIRGATRRRWPGLADEELESAIHDVIEDVLRRSDYWATIQHPDGSALRRVFRMALHRRLARRRQLRSRFTAMPQEVVGGSRPDVVVDARARLDRIRPLCREAARRYGRRHSADLESALLERVVDGGRGTEIARRHGVHREYLSRALCWVRAELAA